MEGVIISPIWFYLIDMLSSLDGICGGFMIILAIICIVFSVFVFCGDNINKKLFKNCLIALSVSICVGIVIPSKETMYTMLVAQNVTYENVEIAADTIKESVDYIFDKLNGE